jgi:hypothetical protein
VSLRELVGIRGIRYLSIEHHNARVRAAERRELALPAQRTLAEAVHVQDRDQIGQVVEASELE